MTPTHRVTLRTTIFKSIANTFDMNAMVGCGLRQLKMLRQPLTLQPASWR
jgi:hypothetical protein